MDLWRPVREENGAPAVVWSTVFPVGFDPDPAIVKAIRSEFQPNYVPVFHRKVYLSPLGRVKFFDYHVIGLWFPTPPDGRTDVIRLEAVDRRWLPFSGGYVFEERVLSWPHDPKSREFRIGLPAVPIDYGWDLYDWMKAAHWHKVRSDRSEKEWKRGLKESDKAERAAEHRTLAKADEDARLRLYDDRYMIRRAIEQQKWADPPKSPPVSIAVP